MDEIPTEEQKSQMRREHQRILERVQRERCDVRYLYCCKWFETKRHTKENQSMYYLNPEDVKWIFNTEDYHNGLARVEYVPVCVNSPSYESAFHNSNIVPTLRGRLVVLDETTLQVETDEEPDEEPNEEPDEIDNTEVKEQINNDSV